jgi:hypothetical protein
LFQIRIVAVAVVSVAELLIDDAPHQWRIAQSSILDCANFYEVQNPTTSSAT